MTTDEATKSTRAGQPKSGTGWLAGNALSVAMFGAFLVFIVLQSVFGWHVRNEELAEYGRAADSYWQYLTTGHFAEAVFENWESEFLQMGAYVLLTAYLVQRGSAESKQPEEKDRPDDDPAGATGESPRASRGHGPAQFLYRNSLALVLFGFFALSFVSHLIGGAAEYNEQQALTGRPPVSTLEFLGSSDFWFQSMQNWQSEFLAVGALIVLSIFLRQHGSPESKPVTAPHRQTGE
ncbi:DUF6766 family protein [Catellatospora coxensis]|uniref:Transmembrane protein n=1 Tax=Catellatospora coxensis TaxID=310354 RepID=A0A8J3KX83_9ACTN|nr:DUF6766 family protein [Catellatospora coxensis]GIG05049.1 hypothetical protein Cco03nite_17490 [Catellatospora coxensis]